MDENHVRITERDLRLLEFVAQHRFVLASQVQTLLGASRGATYRRLQALARAGLLEHRPVFDRHAHAHWITRRGLALLGSSLPPPRLELGEYRHDVGLAWLWLAADRGAFGPLERIVTERQLRSVRPGSGPKPHRPDLVLVCAGGGRVAVELELTTKSRTRRERILAGYAADPRIDAVLYLVEDRRVGRAIEASARRLGISELVHVQRVRVDAGPGRSTGGRARSRESGPRSWGSSARRRESIAR